MAEWPLVALEDLVEQGRPITYGVVKPGDDPPDGVLFLRGQDVVDGRVVTRGARRITPDVSEQYRRTRLRGGEVVVVLVGVPGASAVVSDELVGANIARQLALVAVGEAVLPEFVSMYLRSPLGQTGLSGLTYGSVQQVINLSDLRRLRVPVPTLDEQRAIVGVLGALDDKIESNRRLVATTGALCSSIFELARSDGGVYRSITFDVEVGVFGGSTPSTSNDAYWGEPNAWATPSDITALTSPYLFDTARHITDEGLRSASTVLHPPGSIFMTSRATIGAFAVNQVPCATNQGFIVVRPRRPEHRWFLFHEMVRRVDEMVDRSSGTTFRELSRGSFKAMSLDFPVDEAFFDLLHAKLDPLHTRAAAAARESTALASLRDALLPELLSGRLRVREAEKVIEDVV